MNKDLIYCKKKKKIDVRFYKFFGNIRFILILYLFLNVINKLVVWNVEIFLEVVLELFLCLLLFSYWVFYFVSRKCDRDIYSYKYFV